MNMRAALRRRCSRLHGHAADRGRGKDQGSLGDYVSIYDFQQSIEDGATVPLYYENRTPELQLVNPDLNDQIYDLIERAELDPSRGAAGEGAVAPVPPHHSRRSPRHGGEGHRAAFSRAGASRARRWWFAIDKATALRMYDR